MRIDNQLLYYNGDDATATFHRYQNGRVAITLTDSEGPVATATVNLPDEELGDGEVFIKDYSENAGMEETLLASGIISPGIVRSAVSGFEMINAYALSPEARKEAGL